MRILRYAAACLMLLTVGLMAGCAQDEEILDVETPEGGIEIEKDADSGAIEVETDE